MIQSFLVDHGVNLAAPSSQFTVDDGLSVVDATEHAVDRGQQTHSYTLGAGRRRSGMALSARNRLRGTVQRIETGDLLAEVVVETDGGERVTAIITSASVSRLGIQPGDEVDAVVKATEVMIDAD